MRIIEMKQELLAQIYLTQVAKVPKMLGQLIFLAQLNERTILVTKLVDWSNNNIAIADMSDIGRLAKEDSDVASLIHLLKKIVRRDGVRRVTRIVAYVLAPYKRLRFEEKLEVKESHSMKHAGFTVTLPAKR